MARHLFKGFSTYPTAENEKSRNWVLYDLELVKRDLLYHFHTRKGERAMMPQYGCLIWDILFDPLNESNIELIAAEARRIVDSDSRVQLKQMNIKEVTYGLIINFELSFEPWNVVESFSIEFDRRTREGMNV